MKFMILILSLFAINSCASKPETKENTEPASAKVQPSMDREAVRRTMRDNVSKYKKCYDSEYKKNDKLEGKVVLQWIIKSDGTVGEEKIQSTTLNNDKVEKCLLGVLSKSTFPKPPEGAIADISYPFLFKGSNLVDQ